MKQTVAYRCVLLGIACCAFLSGCSASYRLQEGWRDCSYYTDIITGDIKPMDSLFRSSKLEWRSYYSNLFLDTDSVFGDEKRLANAFLLHGYVEQKKGRRDSIHYDKAILHSILIIANGKDTLKWVMEEAYACAYDSNTRYSRDKHCDAIRNYTADSLPWCVSTSGQDSDWNATFKVRTEPVDIKKVRKLRAEVSFQFDDIIITRVVKARRYFLLWFEPRQGFCWYGPEDIDIWESIL